MTVQTATMRFATITGAALTNSARELMMEGEWKKALTVLMDGLEGMTYDYAIGILEGKSKLEGAGETILMVDESPETMTELQEVYAAEFGFGGFVERNGRMYQAYAVVDNLGFEDTSNVLQMSEVARAGAPREEWLYACETVDHKTCFPLVLPWYLVENRARFYASRPQTDFAGIVLDQNGKRLAVLFQETTEGTTPFWRQKENKSLQAAYDQIAQYLPVTGYSQKFGEVHPNKRPQTYAPTATREPLHTQAERNAEYAAAEKAAAERAADLKSQVELARQQVVEFANNDAEFGWRTYAWKGQAGMPGFTLRAPNRALLCYALSTTNASNLQPEYTPFSPRGLKTAEDNPFHTDVWLGCGFEVDAKTYDRENPQYHAVVDLMFEVQKELLNFEVQVLARGPALTGTVVYHDSAVIDKDSILVIPHAGVAFELGAMKSGAVICEVGGRLAHLVTVCREMNRPIIRMDNALSKLRRGQTVTITPDEGRVVIHPMYVQSYGCL